MEELNFENLSFPPDTNTDKPKPDFEGPGFQIIEKINNDGEIRKMIGEVLGEK